jgi:hypothetical protein
MDMLVVVEVVVVERLVPAKFRRSCSIVLVKRCLPRIADR